MDPTALPDLSGVDDAWTTFVNSGLPGFLGAVLYLGGFYVVWRLIDRILEPALRRARVDPTAQEFLRLLVRYALFSVALIAALGQVGIDTTSLLASLGVVGLTLGFAARDTLSNVISGMFIFWDRPFTLGDLVEIDGHYGRVETITLRSTRVVTPDGRMLAIPNNTIVNSTVASYTNFPHLRIDVGVTVGPNEDVARLRDIIIPMLQGDGYLDQPPPQLVLAELGDYNLAIEVRVWIADERNHVARRFELRERVLEAFRAHDVDMPYETINVNVRSPETS